MTGWNNILIERKISVTYTPTGDILTALVAASEYAGRGEFFFLTTNLQSGNLRFAQISTEKSREAPFVFPVNGFYFEGVREMNLALKPGEIDRKSVV